jgi:hypothetical protein
MVSTHFYTNGKWFVPNRGVCVGVAGGHFCSAFHSYAARMVARFMEFVVRYHEKLRGSFGSLFNIDQIVWFFCK